MSKGKGIASFVSWIAVAASALAAPGASAWDGDVMREASDHSRIACRMVWGDFAAVPPPICASPVGICTRGTLAGNFPSTYNFTVDSLVPDPSNPSLFHYKGHSTLVTADETLTGSDAGVLSMNGDGTANFTTVVTIVPNPGEYQGGKIIASGLMNLMTGSTSGRYGGVVCQ